jgi:CubicO group peptidase (beta-lactamase class C family)
VQANVVAAYIDHERVQETVAKVARLQRFHSVIVAHDGTLVAEQVFRGPGLDHPINIRSAAKAIIGALVGIAIDKGMIKGVDEPILPLLKARAPANLDPKVAKITIDHLLSMRAGLERTSGWPNYDRWVQSPDWVSHVLSRKSVYGPGRNVVYSTGNTHLLSAILTDVSGTDTWQLTQSWLGKPLDIAIRQWKRDPQGIYFGGDETLLSPRDLLRFGEMYRNDGVYGGSQIVPRNWIRASWTPHAIDTGDRVFGYGWIIAGPPGHPVYFAWGVGGQILCVIPSLKLTIVMTCDPPPRAELKAHNLAVHELVTSGFMSAAMPTTLRSLGDWPRAT